MQSKAVARLQALDSRMLSPGELLRYVQVAAETERCAVGEAPAPAGDEEQGEGSGAVVLSWSSR